MPVRIFGKPFTVTEFNYSNPNIYRSEAGPLMGGYAALQNWDGIYRFAWSHFASRLREGAPSNSFDCALDPIMQITDYMIYLLYLRGDVKAAKQAVAFVFNDKLMYDIKTVGWSTGTFPEYFSVLGLYCQIGSLPEGLKIPGVKLCAPSLKNCLKPLPDKFKKISSEIIKTRNAMSETRQIELDVNSNTIKIITPKSEAFCVNTGNISGEVLKVENADSFMTIMVSSIDGKNLANSRRILIFHLTNIANTMATFRTKQRKIVEKRGKLPLLLRAGKADISLKFNGGLSVKVQVLGLNGAVKKRVKFVQTTDGSISFKVNTAGVPGGAMIYYITRN